MKLLTLCLALISAPAFGGTVVDPNQSFVAYTPEGVNLVIVGAAAQEMYLSERAEAFESPLTQDAKSIDGFICVETSKAENYKELLSSKSVFWWSLFYAMPNPIAPREFAEQKSYYNFVRAIQKSAVVCSNMKGY